MARSVLPLTADFPDGKFSRRLRTAFALLAMSCSCIAGRECFSKTWSVSDASGFHEALRLAASGDQVLLSPGVYRGTFHASGLHGVTIRSAAAENPAIIDATGAGEGLKLSKATQVTVSDLIVENASQNGINVDDGGFEQFSKRIVIRNVVVRNGGGHAIKFAGVDGFLIDSVTLQDWGNGHAGINLLGVHNGIVQHSLVRRTNTVGGFGLKVEGGSTNVAIRANRFEEAGERAIQFGGGVGLDPFRARAAAGATGEKLAAEGNVIVNRGADARGIRSAVAFIGARDAEFRHNLVFRPGVFVGRVLNEGIHPGKEETPSRVFRNNLMVWYDGDFANVSPFNVGPDTFPESLHFRANRWLNLSPGAASEVQLPTQDLEPSFGVDAGTRPDAAIAWEFTWGLWIVNATTTSQTHRVAEPQRWKRANPGARAQFGTALAAPLIGDWELADIRDADITLPPMSSTILIQSDGAHAIREPEKGSGR